MDDLDFEPTGHVRIAGRFQPKAKPKSTKVASSAAASNFPNVVTENSIRVSSTVSDSVPSATSVDVGEVKLTYPVGSSSATSEILGSLEPSGKNEHSSVPSFDVDRTTEPSESAAADSMQPSAMVAASNGSDGSHSVYGKSASENADIFSGLECLDDYPTQTTSGIVPASRKSPEKANEGNCGDLTHCTVESSEFLACDVEEAQTVSDYCATQDPVSCTEAAISNEHGDIRLETKEFKTLDLVSEAPISIGRHAGKFQPKQLRVKKGKENPNIPHSEVESTTLSQAANFKTGEMDESSLCTIPPGDVHDHISPPFGDYIAPNPTPNFQANAESLAETTQLDEAVFGDAAHSEGVCGRGHKSGNGKASTVSNHPQKRKGSAADEEAKDGTSSRKSRKRLPRQQVDEPGNNTNEGSFNAENSSDFDGNEDRENNTEQRKRAPRKSKIPVSENEKPVKKRKRTKKAPDEPTEDPTKKKFSHSTRRNRRHVDKSLKDEIDPQKVPMKDLIRLREYRERLAIKEAAKLKTPASNHSAYDEFHKEASDNEEENFGFEQDRSSGGDQAGWRDRVNTSSSSINYQSFMKKERRVKWNEQDTQLLYEGIEQFGSDFRMIALLFPGRTRDQIKLKFKKEDRHNRLRINEAFPGRSEDNSKYVLVINELQKVAREKQESNADESNDQEEVELTHDNDRWGSDKT
ncbi:uncharacterized protein LOC133739483 isoform X2 [Rosa rugosa]|uniref:uncharacterized protein LOC133739483 isoform X2 n=1 Tax=Rosa rugosa TaxID=74645 RepID=UPI002B411B0B|nr:uncharacterized protein LOC133739483 isoform X2 [Rosa rugosa]